MISKKATRVWYKLSEKLSTTNTAVLFHAYKSYIKPILEYGTPPESLHGQALHE